jgi:hypothetical protein
MADQRILPKHSTVVSDFSVDWNRGEVEMGVVGNLIANALRQVGRLTTMLLTRH